MIIEINLKDTFVLIMYIYYVFIQALILLPNRTNSARLVHQRTAVHANVGLQLTSSQWQKQ